MPIVKLGDITKTEVKVWFGIDASDTGKDALITQSLPGCVAQICNYCRHDFEQKSRSETIFIEAEDRFNLFTKYRPLTSASLTVVENGVTLVEDTDFYVVREIGKLVRMNETGWISAPKKVVLTYTGGVLLADAADVQTVFYELVGITCGIKTRTYVDGEGVEKSIGINALSQNYLDILERWKQWRV